MATSAQTFRRRACSWFGLTLATPAASAATPVTKLAAALSGPSAGDCKVADRA